MIEGEAPGADLLAAEWCAARGKELAPFPANWGRYGNSAGPIRNTQMLIVGKPDLVVAFPGGNGTTNMVRQTLLAGVQIRIVDEWLNLETMMKFMRGAKAAASS